MQMRARSLSTSLSVCFLTLTSITVVACTIGESRDEVVKLPAVVNSEILTCNSPYIAVDLSAQKPCGDGKGHCYDKAKLPIPQERLTACPGSDTDVCVPDKLLLSNGKKLATCNFFIGNKPGACVSMVFKDVAAAKDELQQDSCDPDERCIPCINPVDGSDTHICDEVGAHQADCIGGSAASSAETCCYGQGECAKSDGVPPGSASSLVRETCPADKLCAPRALIENTPVKCNALALSGVCLDVCFAAMLKSTAPVMRGGCGPTEVCMPCVLGNSGSMKMPGC